MSTNQNTEDSLVRQRCHQYKEYQECKLQSVPCLRPAMIQKIFPEQSLLFCYEFSAHPKIHQHNIQQSFY